MDSLSRVEHVVGTATLAAEHFVQRYYAAIDTPIPHRSAAVQACYLPSSRITWNGNPIAFVDLPAFLERMPKSVHEVQAFDCHPIAGSAGAGVPASLVVSVTGQVTHGEPIPQTRTTASVSSRDFEFLPRVFSQSFILALDTRDQNGAYGISADAFRFC